MEDNVKFCPGCGEAQNDMGDPIEAVKDGLKKNKMLIGKIAVIALAAIIVIVLLVKLFTPGYKKAANKYLDAFEDLKISKMLDFIPDFMLGDLDKDELRDLQSDLEDELKDSFEDVKISFTITDTSKMDSDAIESLEETADLVYDESVNIKKGYYVTAKMTAKKDGEKASRSYNFQVIKIGSKWYVYDTTIFGSLLY